VALLLSSPVDLACLRGLLAWLPRSGPRGGIPGAPLRKQEKSTKFGLRGQSRSPAIKAYYGQEKCVSYVSERVSAMYPDNAFRRR
jgi:hypothetical protein